MKRSKFKKRKLLVIIGIAFFVLLLVLFFLIKGKKRGLDFKIGVLADDGIALISISPQRNMINVLKIKEEGQLWVPEGFGWYRSVSIKQLLKQEKRMDLIDDIFFYNFGFKPDRIAILSDINDWKKRFWLRFRFNYNRVLLKEEFMGGSKNQENILDEVMIRDFAETKIVLEDLKLSVFNTSNINGLAGFIARRLEWLGLSVMTTETLMDNEVEFCLVRYGGQVDQSFAWRIIMDLFDKCQVGYDSTLNSGEIELYIGSEFSSMIKYPSYN